MNKRPQKKEKGKSTKRKFIYTKPTYLGDKNIPTTIELLQYNNKRLDMKNISADSPLKDSIDSSKVNWFKITGISDAATVNRICREFGLHSFDVKDLLSDQQVAKAIVYDKVTYILMSSFFLEEDNINVDDIQIAFILGENFVISFQEAAIPVFDDVKKEIEEDNVSIRQYGADFLLYILMSAVNFSNLGSVMSIEDQLTEIENRLIRQTESANILQRLHTYRINYMRIKRSIVAIREEYSNLLHNTNKLIKEENIVYFNDFDDRMRTTLGNLSSLHEALTSLLDLYYNNNNLKMNDIIKRLTIISSIFIPLTFLVGVWGMNFRFMPETEWQYGYLFAWLSLAIIAIGSYLWIRKQKWF